MSEGTAFTHRDLIIFITFVVFFVTLIFQSLTLPYIIRVIRIGELDPVLPQHGKEGYFTNNSIYGK